MSESMYKIIGKAYCSANPDCYWVYEECPSNKRQAFMIYSKIKHKNKSKNNIVFNDAWCNFDKDACTRYMLDHVISEK